jgi:BASS family bile acid:Na+ symporter
MNRFLTWFTNLYIVWLLASALAAFLQPESMSWITGQWIVWALSVTMFAMGITLSPGDFRGVLAMPGAVALGILCQYTLMPLSGWTVARVMNLDPEFAVGLILVATCPGGMASNMISYLAKANVALSIILTAASTLIAFVATPLWMKGLAGQYVAVDAIGLCRSTLEVVVAPVVIGVFINWRFPRATQKISLFGPAVAVSAICLITAGIVSASAEKIAENFGLLFVAATALHVLGFALGYFVPRVLRYPETVARTVSIEVGMQNGGMAAALAATHFATQPFVAVPAVFSAVMQNLLGSVLASWWGARPAEVVQEEPSYESS